MFTISKYLQDELKTVFNQDSTLIKNGIHYDLIGNRNFHKKVKVITLILRNNVMKGDWLLLDIIKKIGNRYHDLEINVVYSTSNIEFPYISNNSIRLNKILGPLSRNDVYQLLQQSDVYIDCSLSEGFGLTALESMAAGCVPIVSNSKGVLEYVEDGRNGFVIQEMNDSDAYIKCLDQLIEDHTLYTSLKNNASITAQSFDFDKIIDIYIDYLHNNRKFKTKKEKLNEQDKIIVNSMTKTQSTQIGKKRKIYKLARIIPKGVKNRLKKIITFLYFCFEH